MLALGMKTTSKLSISKYLPKLAAECADKYADTPEFIEKLDGWREKMRRAGFQETAGGATECKEIMFEYAKIIAVAAHRFRGADLAKAKFKFEWNDSFLQDSHIPYSDFAYERVCILFNAVASLSFLGTHEDRGTPDGIKTACNSFQQAAAVLETIMEEVRLASWTNLPTDLTNECLEMLRALMLAQAQKVNLPPRLRGSSS